ncbi:MAG: hypothetical protein ACKO0V_07380, partial [bacterium]
MLNRTRISMRKKVLSLAVLGFSSGFVSISIADDARISEQLIKLGRQAQAQGYAADARNFYTQALKLDPKNTDAKAGISELGEVRQVAFRAQQEAPAAPAANTDKGQANAEQPRAATIENLKQIEAVANQQFAAEVRMKQQAARNLLNQNNPEAALNELHQAMNMVVSAPDVSEEVKAKLKRELEASILTATREEETILERQADQARRAAIADARARSLQDYEDVNATVKVMLDQFDNLISQGIYDVMYSGGLGNIGQSVEHFVQARLLAQKARALRPFETAPVAAEIVASRIGFYAMAREYETLKEFNYLLSLADVDRAAVPFPDDNFIAYPS